MRTQLLILLCISQFVFGQIVTFETDGITPTQPNLHPQTVETGIAASPLIRGAGLTATGTAANTFSAANFLGLSFEDAKLNEQFFEFSITVDNGHIVTPESMEVTIRRSGTGPKFFQWAYNTTSTNQWEPFGATLFYDGTQTNGAPLASTTFPEAPELVNILPGETLFIRLYAWGASSAGGIASIGRLAGPDLKVNGTVTPLGSQALVLHQFTPLPICLSSGQLGAATAEMMAFGTFNNEPFSIELSDEWGSFTNPLLLYSGFVTGTNTSLSIPLSLPNTLVTSTQYRIRSTSSTSVLHTTSHPNTIINGTPSVSHVQSVPNDGEVSLSWTNPLGCFDEIMVLVSENSITYQPSGAGTSYLANTQFGMGSPIGNSYVVFKDNATDVLITGLQNGTTYYYAIYTRKALEWSTAIAGTFVPDIPKIGWQIEQAATWYTIDFDQSVAQVNEGTFLGMGISPNPQSGMLHADAWRITGLPDEPNPNFGNDLTFLADFTRGTSGGGIATRGLWSFEVQPNNFALGVQPIGTGFNPGTITLRWENKTGATVTDLEIAYTFYEYNDQNRSSYWQFGHGLDDATIQLVTETYIETIELSAAQPIWEASKFIFKINNVAIPDGAAYYFQWISADAGGSGLRDELALDDIQLKVHHQTPLVYNPLPIEGDFKKIYVAENLNTVILPNTQISVKELTLDGTLVAKADATGYGQLHHDEVSGIGNLYSELYVPQGNGAWHYLSFPSGTPYTAIHDGVSRFNITDPDESPLFEWDAAVGDWVLPKGGASGSFEGGKGYIVYMGQNATGTYTTTLPATLTLALPLTSPQNQQLALDYTASPNFMNINGTHIEGWNFIGNPFPSAYDLFQSAISPNVLASAVRRNATNTGFETYVFTEPHVASRYIAPNQAIWVRSLSAANADFEWQLSKRSPQETPIRTKNDEITSFFLEVVGPQGVPDETRIYFRDAATNGFDREYDGDKLPNDKGYPNLYTVTENLPYAVNSLPYFDELTVLPLAFTCDCNGLFRLRLKEKIGQYNIYLKEKNSSKLLDLTNEEFRFFSNGGDEEQVFELVFSNQPRVALDWKNYTAWFAQNSLFIRPVTATNQLRYRLTDIQGRYMANGSINESQSVFEIPLTYVASGVYVLYVTSEEGGTEVIKMVKH